MKRELSDYAIHPKILATGVLTRITLRPLGEHAAFRDAEYLVRFLPMCATLEGKGEAYKSQIVRVQENGNLSFEHAFPGEQAHIVRVFRLPIREGEPDTPLGSFLVYSLEPDLFALRPYRGDFHAHSCRSDGRESPAVVAANYRKSGFDFMAITDHHQWQPSEEAIQAFAGQPIDLKLFHGEEIHPPRNHVHMVAFGGAGSVNALFEKDIDRYEREVAALQNSVEVPPGVNAFEYASCAWVFDRIREVGGLGIYCHPYWISDVYHVAEAFTDFLFEKKPFDAFELLGGHEAHSNNLQTAYYQESRARGITVPVVGSSDSHGTEDAQWFTWLTTIVFSRDADFESIRESVLDLRSVAVEHYPGEAFRVHGPFRLVKYADFLLNEYFPLHDLLCEEEGRLMKDLACGDPGATPLLALMQGRTAIFLERCFGKV